MSSIPFLFLLLCCLCASAVTLTVAAASGSVADAYRICAARPTVSEDGQLNYQVQWINGANNASQSDFQLPLMHSLLAHWHNGSARVCENEHGSECFVDARLLPRGEPVALSLLTECDLARVPAERWQGQQQQLQRECKAALSPPFEIVLPRPRARVQPKLRPRRPPPRTILKTPSRSTNGSRAELGTDPSIIRVIDDAQVREVLAQFYSLTWGVFWTHHDGWTQANVSVCDWTGLGCTKDASGQYFINQMLLPSNNLNIILAMPRDDGNRLRSNLSSSNSSSSSSDDAFIHPPRQASAASKTDGLSINFVWETLWRLEGLDLSHSGNLGYLNLTLLTRLQFLTLESWNQPPDSATPSPPWTMLPLPQNSELTFVDLSFSGLQIDLRCTPKLETLYLYSNYAPFEFHWIWSIPLVQTLDLGSSLVNSSNSTMVPHGGLLGGGNLTHYILANLETTNPQLQTLVLTRTPLTFGPAHPEATDSNMPTIRAPLLEDLELSYLPQLVSGLEDCNSNFLETLPKLQSLSMQSLPFVQLNTSAFKRASNRITDIDLTGTSVVGDLTPLFGLRNLESLVLDYTGIASPLPPSVRAYWPVIEVISARQCALFGSMPSFASLHFLAAIRLSYNQLTGALNPDFIDGCPTLVQLFIDNNALTGHLPPIASSSLLLLDVSDNQFSGSLPDWQLPALNSLKIIRNSLEGSIPPRWFHTMPSLVNFDASYNNLTGEIPGGVVERYFYSFVMIGNSLTGPLPFNISASHFDLSFNRLSGPIFLPYSSDPDFADRQLTFLNLAGQQGDPTNHGAQLSCPIRLAEQSSLTHLDLHGSGFAQCDFDSPYQVELPHDALVYLDISDCLFNPFTLRIEPQHQVILAANASVQAFGVSNSATIDSVFQLNTLILDNNPLFGGDPDPTSVARLDASFDSISNFVGTLQIFSCQGCNIHAPVQDVLLPFSAALWGALSAPVLQQLNLANNFLMGSLPSTLFTWQLAQIAADGVIIVLPQTLQSLNLAGNAWISGVLPPVAAGYVNLQTISLAYTGVEGTLPDSWANLLALADLDVRGTYIHCELTQHTDGNLVCILPKWVVPSVAATQIPLDEDLDNWMPGVHCSLLQTSSSGAAATAGGTLQGIVQADNNYSSSTFCRCDAGYFGTEGVCLPCPDGCRCPGGDIIADCWPRIKLGYFERSGETRTRDGGDNDADGAGTGIVSRFELTMIIPCQLTVNVHKIFIFVDV